MKKGKHSSILAGVFSIILVLGALITGWSKTEAVTGQTAAENTQTAMRDSSAETGMNVPDTADGDMEVHFLDVGQGDCILISCDGCHMLVDAGNNQDGEMITSYLKEQGIAELDYVIGTHPHADHIGGLDTVIDNFGIKTLFMPQKVHTTATFEEVIAAIENHDLSITAPKPGDTYPLGSGSFTILAPVKEDYGEELNNWSIGIKLVHGSNSIVMCGDAEEEAEEDICSSGLDISADVLKLGHHGSRTASGELFLKTVGPKYAIISCGRGNDYGHPHEETLKKLSEAGILVFRTDTQGTIILKSDGKSLRFNVEPDTSMKQGE